MILVNVLLGFSQYFCAIPIMNPLPWFMIYNYLFGMIILYHIDITLHFNVNHFGTIFLYQCNIISWLLKYSTSVSLMTRLLREEQVVPVYHLHQQSKLH